jgi:hypothetical protein
MSAIDTYQSPPGSGSNNGALPKVYDPNWQRYKNLTPAQVVAFQSFPQDLMKYAILRRWLTSLSGTTASVTPIGAFVPIIIQLKTDGDSMRNTIAMRQAIDDGLITTIPYADINNNPIMLDATNAKMVHQAMAAFLANIFNAYAQIVRGINRSTITTRKQIDAIYAPLAPNSPSGLNPSSS